MGELCEPNSIKLWRKNIIVVNIPSDLRKNKETIIGNMDLRECICLFLGLLLAIFILYYIRVILGYKSIMIAAFIAGIFIIPFLFIGFKRINGMKIDDYFKVFVNNKIIANQNRVNACQRIEPRVSSGKYEIIRCYKLFHKAELLTLRKYLLDKNILILTEYIDYKNDKLVIFRIDGKEMILEQIRRNKVAINNKKSRIKALHKDKLCEPDKMKQHLNELKLEKKYLQRKTFNDLKNEVNIFENLENVEAERIQIKTQYKKKKGEIEDEYISSLRQLLNDEERAIKQLHLFNKVNFKSIIEGIGDKIVFINNDNEVDVYYYDVGAHIAIPYEGAFIDSIDIDKKSGIYESTILSLEARNFYNHYRCINGIEEIL